MIPNLVNRLLHSIHRARRRKLETLARRPEAESSTESIVLRPLLADFFRIRCELEDITPILDALVAMVAAMRPFVRSSLIVLQATNAKSPFETCLPKIAWWCYLSWCNRLPVKRKRSVCRWILFLPK